MNASIQAICFDIGGTLRTGQDKDAGDLAYIRKLQAVIGDPRPAEEFRDLVRAREKQYRRWCKRSLVELSEADLWSKYLLPDLDAGFIRANAVRLNQMWRESRDKPLLPDAVETLRELARRGYRLAIVSNTTSSVEVPELLEANGIRDLFGSVILSTVFGRRKPHPSLFLAAAREIGVRPEHCAYVGDILSRDLVGARQAGFGEVVIIKIQGYQKDENDPDDDPQNDEISEMQPDARIRRLSSLLDLYPRRGAEPVPQEAPRQPERLYDAALSTMWWNKDADDAGTFFGKGRALGFARFELNHQIPPQLLDTIDLDHFHMGSLHDPCPAVIFAKQLEREDRVITSLDRDRRQFAVDGVKRTIEQAWRLGARSVVVHPGRVAGDHSLDEQLRQLYKQGRQAAPEYSRLKAALIADRKARGGPHLEALLESLLEIVAFAQATGLALGFENRFHYYELPIEDEMEALLEEFRQPCVGWQLDVGHLQVHAVLGLMSFRGWLERFGARIVGVHLHDVQGIVDHRAPGSGEVDFELVAAHLPSHAQRTLEVDKSLTFEEVRGGMEVLANAGCVTRL